MSQNESMLLIFSKFSSTVVQQARISQRTQYGGKLKALRFTQRFIELAILRKMSADNTSPDEWEKIRSSSTIDILYRLDSASH
jgi:hypothetical protein